MGIFRLSRASLLALFSVGLFAGEALGGAMEFYNDEERCGLGEWLDKYELEYKTPQNGIANGNLAGTSYDCALVFQRIVHNRYTGEDWYVSGQGAMDGKFLKAAYPDWLCWQPSYVYNDNGWANYTVSTYGRRPASDDNSLDNSEGKCGVDYLGPLLLSLPLSKMRLSTRFASGTDEANRAEEWFKLVEKHARAKAAGNAPSFKDFMIAEWEKIDKRKPASTAAKSGQAKSPPPQSISSQDYEALHKQVKVLEDELTKLREELDGCRGRAPASMRFDGNPRNGNNAGFSIQRKKEEE